MMTKAKAEIVRQELILFFEREFKEGRAEVTMTGTVKFQTEKTFGLYYQLSERLKKSHLEIYIEMLTSLRKWYAGKDLEDMKDEQHIRESDRYIQERIHCKEAEMLFEELIIEDS